MEWKIISADEGDGVVLFIVDHENKPLLGPIRPTICKDPAVIQQIVDEHNKYQQMVNKDN